jgi:peptide/nickel transport system permease protein
MAEKVYQCLISAPWLSIYPGMAIFLAVLAFNLFGDGLRQLLDPRLRGRGQA